MSPKKSKIAWFSSLAILLIIFCVLACYNDWDKDEAWSYLNIKGSSFTELFQYAKFRYANHHILNSFWFKFLFNLGVKNAFLYRLPSIIVFLAYAWFINKLFSTEKSAWYELFIKLSFLLLPFAEYFALGRGYALAITAFTGSFYYFKQALQNPDNGNTLRFILLGSLSSLAIFSFIFPFLAMALFYFIVLLQQKKLTYIKFLIFTIAIPFLYYVYVKGKIVNEYDDSITGTNSPLDKDFILPFIGVFTYYKYLGSVFLLKLFINAFLGFTVLYAVFIMLRRKLYFSKELIIVIIVFGLLMMSNIVFKSKYPTERALLYIILLFYAMLASFLLATGNRIIRAQFVVLVLIGAIGMFFVVKHAIAFNTLDAMRMIDKPKSKLLVADYVPDPNVHLYNELYFNDGLTILRSNWDDTLFDKKIADADYVFTGNVMYAKYLDKFNKDFELKSHFLHDYRDFVFLKRK